MSKIRFIGMKNGNWPWGLCCSMDVKFQLFLVRKTKVPDAIVSVVHRVVLCP